MATLTVRSRRLRTNEALAVFDITTVRRTLLGEDRTPHLKVLEGTTLYVDPRALRICILARAGRLPVKLAVQKQHRGVRLFWKCPRSGRAVSLLYLVETSTGPVIGSRAALGLSYPSQALHRTPAYDGAVYLGYLRTTRAVYRRVASRCWQRQSRGIRRAARELL